MELVIKLCTDIEGIMWTNGPNCLRRQSGEMRKGAVFSRGRKSNSIPEVSDQSANQLPPQSDRGEPSRTTLYEHSEDAHRDSAECHIEPTPGTKYSPKCCGKSRTRTDLQGNWSLCCSVRYLKALFIYGLTRHSTFS